MGEVNNERGQLGAQFLGCSMYFCAQIAGGSGFMNLVARQAGCKPHTICKNCKYQAEIYLEYLWNACNVLICIFYRFPDAK